MFVSKKKFPEHANSHLKGIESNLSSLDKLITQKQIFQRRLIDIGIYQALVE